MKKYYENLLEKFVQSCGISGRSEEVASVFKDHAEKLNLITGIDMLGSVLARLNGQTCYLNSGYKRKILIIAHQDCLDLKLKNKIKTPNKIDKSTRGKYKAFGLDNRAGLLSVCLLMETALKSKIYDDLYFVATALDVKDCHGSFVCAEKIKPTIVINIDTIEVDKKSFLGKGPVIVNSSTINKKLFDLIKESAKKNKIPTQYIINQTDNMCSSLIRAAGGLACCDIRIPIYYDAYYTGAVSKKDIENCTKLTHKLIININRIESFLPEV